jgi:hypothetical protein
MAAMIGGTFELSHIVAKLVGFLNVLRKKHMLLIQNSRRYNICPNRFVIFFNNLVSAVWQTLPRTLNLFSTK